MISMLCQKKNTGIISPENKELFNLVILGESEPKNDIRSTSNFLKNDTNLDSSFLKKFPTRSRTEKREELKNIIKSESNTLTRSHTETGTLSPGVYHPKSSTHKTDADKTGHSTTPYNQNFNISNNTIANTSNNNTNYALDPTRVTADYYNQHPLKKLNPKNIKSMQNWITQKINQDPVNLEYYHKLNEVIVKERLLNEEITRNIEQADVKQLRKKELIYKNWYLNVYEPIQSEVLRNMNSPHAQYARATRNLRYLEYLQQVNKKGYVFQDDFQPEEYDPTNIIPLDACLPNKLKDPTSVSQRKNFNEEKTIYKCITGKTYSQSQIERTKLPIIINDNETRADIDWQKWILNDHNTMESNVRKKS